MFEISEKKYIKLNAGDPDVEAPKWVIDTALEAISKGGRWTHYSGSEILLEFQNAVVDYYGQFGPIYEPNNIIPTAGSSAALYIALATVLEKGDEILLYEPTYRGHFNLFRDMNVNMSVAQLISNKCYHLNYEELDEHISPQTKAIIVCNPNNPTGTVFTKEELRAIGDAAIENDLTVFSDEIYLHFVYDDNRFISTSSLEGLKERTINIMSFSKTFSMTGWRLGYMMAPDDYIEKAWKIARMTAPRPATFVYAAGIAALKGDMSYVEERKNEYDKRRKFFCKAVNDIEGLNCHLFEGAFYAWIDARSYKMGSEEFCSRLLKQQNVNFSPGHTFGLNTDGFIRVPLVQPIPILEEVIDRLNQFVDLI